MPRIHQLLDAFCLGSERQYVLERLVEDGAHVLGVLEEQGWGNCHILLHCPTVLDHLVATVMLAELPSTVLGRAKDHLPLSAPEGVHVAFADV